MMTFKDYADRAGVSRQAISRQVNAHRDNLDGHIIMQGRTQYLDDDAVKYLDDLRASDPVVVQHADQTAETEALRAERDQLKDQLIALQQRMIQQLADSSTQVQQITATHNDQIQRLQDRCETLMQQLADASRRENDLRSQLQELEQQSFWRKIAFWRK